MNAQRPRPTSDTAAVAAFANGRRPFGEGAPGLAGHYPSTEARTIDRWFEDLSNYEKMLEQISEVKLLDSFKEELRVIDTWCAAGAMRPAVDRDSGSVGLTAAWGAGGGAGPPQRRGAGWATGLRRRTRASGPRCSTRSSGTARRCRFASL